MSLKSDVPLKAETTLGLKPTPAFLRAQSISYVLMDG